jgi:AcrR family transcriptional regulator
MLEATAQTKGDATKGRLVEAAIETLRSVGYAGASARAIAATAGCNQALVFYHFGSVRELLLAALDETGHRRMNRYRAAMEQVSNLADLMHTATAIFHEDLESGHMTVLAEMIAASSSVPGMAQLITARLRPWFDLTEDVIGRVLPEAVTASLVPTRDAAYGIVALYLGMEMLAHLDENRTEGADSLFAVAAGLASLLGGLPAGRGPDEGRARTDGLG